MRDSMRLAATLIIWIALAAVMGILAGVAVAMGDQVDYVGAGMLFLLAVTLLVAVTTSTQAIWTSERTDPEHNATAKAKRALRNGRSRIERLVEVLDDDEIYELEALLLGQQAESRQHGDHVG
jgi:hypothetical protein